MFSAIAVLNFISAFFFKEIPQWMMNFQRYSEKIKQSVSLIKEYKMYIIFLLVIFYWGTPSLIETSEYYYTKILHFTNKFFGFLFILQTILVIFAIVVIKL